ncbi:MAG: hypothetical protein ABSB74_05260 [Tepidisphaeraceae bacterium]
MTVTIQLQDQTVEALAAQAAVRGISLEAYLVDLAKTHAHEAQAAPILDAVRDFDQTLDELFAGDARPLPSFPLSYSREDIYSDRD